MTEVTDALGDPIRLGSWYGYSRSDGGWAHTTTGRAEKITKTGKVRLVDCRVKRYLYGEATDFRADEKPADVAIRAAMVFPVPEHN